MKTKIFEHDNFLAAVLCVNCSVNLVKWALPRAELLMGGWIVALVNESWMARIQIAGLFRKLPFVGRKSREMTPSQTDGASSQSPGARSASD